MPHPRFQIVLVVTSSNPRFCDTDNRPMPALSESAIANLLIPYLSLSEIPATLLPRLSTYLDLLLKWNARTNLTAIRDPEEIVRRHFGESLFAARHLNSPDLDSSN